MNRITCFAAAFVVLLSVGAVKAVDMDWVTVGNPGNAPDTEVMHPDGTARYGSVDYAYKIGRYEVTTGQYTDTADRSRGGELAVNRQV